MNRENWLTTKLRALHANQSGAVAFVVLCGILISLMMGLVIYDTTPAARQKLEVQTAADTAVWSQSAVEARTMNMITFVNIAKRVAIGQSLYYEMLWAAWIIVMIAMIALLVLLIVAAILSFGGATDLAVKQGITVANVAIIMINEAEDLYDHHTSINTRLEQDLQALDDYQTHFQALTPWWSWGEAWRRGLRNGAYVSGWPVPDNYLAALSDIPEIGSSLTSNLTDELPIERYPNYGELCVRSLVPDLPLHFADYLYQVFVACDDCTTDQPSNTLIPRAGLYPIAGAIAMGLYFGNCVIEFTGEGVIASLLFSDDYLPFQLKEPGNQADWYRMTSNIVFSYRPGRDFQGDRRTKYGYMSRDYEASMDLVYKPDGMFGMARSEFSYENDDLLHSGNPDMWHPSWSVRMRPMALPQEWSSYSTDFRLVSAFMDTVPYIAAGAALMEVAGLLGDTFGGGTVMGDPHPEDLVKALLAFDGMTNTNIEGVAR